MKVRLSGDDDDVRLVAELLTEHLPVVTADRVQVGEPSAPYPNRRDGGSRRYVEVYLLDDAVHVRAEPDDTADSPAALPAARARATGIKGRPGRGLGG
ncbi:hypothetical protein ACLQ2P_07215 [Actinomadura citrea]|uniref:hypothetical protein n=1 Tax=Actinomadura citrea TaxID=46158 RepID=UPI003CE5AEA5